ncbi:hypothetical protein PX860_10645 [Agrobacterium leguminum]|uniref:hypothetical protein n=1 Tax=Agrobacterium leguminum TaxID=2792015 RepID=UPI00272D721F|nr:hypothetical protein [Agrobacterium leguminum]WLD96025.1 hypothetical protein PX860_10645 [Agrobacterium leguminum]
MKNESCPRRARRRKAHRRGSQQAGRIGRAKVERGRSLDCLHWNLKEIAVIPRDLPLKSSATDSPHLFERRRNPSLPTRYSRLRNTQYGGEVRLADIKERFSNVPNFVHTRIICANRYFAMPEISANGFLYGKVLDYA